MKEKIRDKYWSVDDPKNDIDFVEISVDEETLDQILQKHGPNIPDKEFQHRSKRKKEKLIRKIFKGAATTLTDRQFQIFILRTVCALKEKVIAQQLGVNQSYISNVLRVSNQKIRTILRINMDQG